jgi:hypothetical protein
MVYVTNHLQMTPAGRRAGLIQWVIYIPWWLKKKSQGVNPLFFGTPYSLALLPRHTRQRQHSHPGKHVGPLSGHTDAYISIYPYIHGWTDTTTTRPASPSVRMLPRLTPEHLQSSSPPPAPTTIRHLSRQSKTTQHKIKPDNPRQSNHQYTTAHPSAPKQHYPPPKPEPSRFAQLPSPPSLHPSARKPCMYIRTYDRTQEGRRVCKYARLPACLPVRMPTPSTAVAHPPRGNGMQQQNRGLPSLSLSLSFPFLFLDHKGLGVRGREGGREGAR